MGLWGSDQPGERWAGWGGEQQVDTWSLLCDQGQEARGAARTQTTWWEDGARWTMDLGLDPTWRRVLGQERSS